MKHSYYILALLLFLLLLGCDNGELEPEKNVTFQFEGTVIGQGLDCGAVYLVDLINISGNAEITDGRYYADNLPSEHKIKGLEIELNCRLPNTNEMYPCTTMGPTYPHIYILEVQPKTQ